MRRVEAEYADFRCSLMLIDPQENACRMKSGRSFVTGSLFLMGQANGGYQKLLQLV